jgi:phenylacetic acid degradation operon negative regulatory protein
MPAVVSSSRCRPSISVEPAPVPLPVPPPKALILDVYGAYGRRLGGWLAIADLIRLMADLGQDDQAVRSATSRMKKSGLLAAESRHGLAGYALTDQARQILSDGDQRIFNSTAPADLDEGWAIAVFSVPETERGRRHVLRSQLAWLGFGQVANGVWIAPRRALADSRRSIERHGLARYVSLFEGTYAGFDSTKEMVARTWDLADIEQRYQRFLSQIQPGQRRWAPGGPGLTDRDAFVDFTFTLSSWRRLPYADPGLPPDLLPRDWSGERAREAFNRLADRLQDRAYAYVAATVGGVSVASGHGKVET